jgi:DNA topoisomerase I
MKLVIVESPAKAKTIEKYLGKEYKVKSSKGHVVDLPKSGLGVDVDHNYTPDYQVTKPAVLQELRQALKGVDTLVLASDPDREGEAIGWHIATELKVTDRSGRHTNKKIGLERIVFTEITKEAVQNAAANPRKIDMNLVDAQQARRILDRLVGYKLSPLLWKKIRYGLSAGRVQSVAVRLIVDRERERESFNADEYWNLIADIRTEKTNKIEIVYKLKTDGSEEESDEEVTETIEYDPNVIKVPFTLTQKQGKKFEAVSKAEIDKVISEVESKKWIVADVKKEESRKFPSPPFSTSTLQQTAANRLGFASARTMKIAQKLYEAGQITYMRTDSLHLSQQAIEAARKYLSARYGAKFVPEKPIVYKSKSKVAQEAHEAIRPTHFEKDAKSLGLSGDEERLYKLIRERALASQMLPAILESHTVKVNVDDYAFQAIGKQVLFKGYLEVYPDKVSEFDLPKMEVGQQVYPEKLLGTQHFTQPPARFSEASLIKELERLGIGRPSTYAPIIHTIQQRQYVEKEGRYFIPTDTGKVVTDLLVKYFEEIVDAGFTAQMENNLDEVANGSEEWVKMIDNFYKSFSTNLDKQDKKIKKEEFTKLGDSKEKCPDCGKAMIIKLGRFGRFLSCSDFPECKGMMSMDGKTDEDVQEQVKTKEFKETYLDAPKTEDGRDFLLKRGKFGEFWAHPDYPKVKDARPLELLPEKIVELYGEPPKTEDGRDYALKNGKFGKFWAHPDYPEVKDIIKIKTASKSGAKTSGKATKKRAKKASK